MANPKIGFNQRKADPTLKDLLDLHKKDIMLSLNCHAIGTIQSFDPDQQTANVTINYKKTYSNRNEDGTQGEVYKDYPQILDAPVVVLRGGSASLTFPIAQGDECLILFNDRAIDSWFQSGQVGPVPSSRFHSFSDALILVGVSSLASVLENYDMTRVRLSNDETVVGLGPKVLINNAAGVSLGTSLNNLTTALTQLTTILTTAFAGPTPSPGNPLSPGWAAAVVAVNTAITNVETQIGGLLE